MTLSNAPGAADVFDVLGGYWGIAAVLIIYWFYLNERGAEITFFSLLLWAIVFRIIGVFGSPILEDDFYRYLLDGCLFVSSGSPYGIAPSSLFLENTLTPECREALNWVNNPDVPTIYGPLLQYVFAFSHLVSPANINLLQLILVLFDLGVIILLRQFASPNNILLYAWNPLVIKEIAFTAHPDIIGVFLVLAAFVALARDDHLKASVYIALACCAKVFALLAVPFILLRVPPKYWLASLFTGMVMYAPFLFQGHTDLFVVGIFAERWVFNPTAFEAFRFFLSDQGARFLCLVLFLAFYGWYMRMEFRAPATPLPRLEWIFGVFFLLSPVFNAWYLLWLLPFAVMHRCYWAWAASLAVSLSYLTGLNLFESNLRAYEIAFEARALEILIVLLAVVMDYRHGH